MTLSVALPWQHAERDSGWYSRALALLQPPSWYNWKADRVDDQGYMPMVWQAKHGDWFTAQIIHAQLWRGQHDFYLIGNEPERAEQSNTSPAEFADAIRTWLALVGGQWAGPGVLWGDSGRAWLAEYIRIGGPIPDYWAIHIYGSQDVQGWKDQYTDAAIWLDRRVTMRPIWVTETNGSADLLHFLANAQYVTAYWYSAHDYNAGMHSADLVNADATQLTDLGRLYVSLQGPSGTGTQVQAQAYMPIARDV